MKFASTISALLIILIATGAFLISGDILALVPASVGILLGSTTYIPLLHRVPVFVAFAGMVFSASSLQRAVRVLSGAEEDHATAVVATALMGVICVVHVTMSIRWHLAQKRSPSA